MRKKDLELDVLPVLLELQDETLANQRGRIHSGAPLGATGGEVQFSLQNAVSLRSLLEIRKAVNPYYSCVIIYIILVCFA